MIDRDKITRDTAEAIAQVLNLHRARFDQWFMQDLVADFGNAFPEFHWYLNRDTMLAEVYES